MNDERAGPQVEWDEVKRATNIAKHRLDFVALDEGRFEWDTAFIRASLSGGEPRLKAIGLIGSRVCVLIFVIRRTSLRVISLRDAHRKEALEYAEYTDEA